MYKYINYRPEIDGLRTLAVLSVIFYHSSVTFFDKKFLPGGFIGVDIFFVISGYLITKIILKEIEKTSKFSFINFYIRRIKRIIPALFFVIIATFPLIYLKSLPNFFVDYIKSIISIIFFVSNIFFWSLGVGYDQLQNVQFQPFLHAWTLSLEEQFYFFFPIILFLIVTNFKKKLLWFILFGFFFSLILCDYMSYAHASVNFYFLPTRAWEFLAGSLLVFIEKKNFYFFTNIFNSVCITFGFFLIGFSILFFEDNMYLPSIVSLIPIIGVSLIIHFSYKDDYSIRILSSKIFTGVGKISYSLYLWHYPIFILYPNLNFLYQIILIFLFSIITYFFVEKKFRFNTNSNIYSIKIIAFTGFLILLSMVVFFKLSKNFDYEKYPKILQKVLKEKFLIETQSHLELDNNVINKDKVNLHIAGDSHMQVLWKALRNDKRIKKYNLINQNLSNGCYYVYNFHREDLFTGKRLKPCTIDDQKKRRDSFISKKDSIVIIGGRLPLWLNNSSNKRISRFFDKKDLFRSGILFVNDNNVSLESGIKDSIYDLLNNDIKVVLIYPVPVLEFNPIKKIFDSYMFNKINFEYNILKNPFTISYSDFLSRASKSHKLLNSISHPNLFKIYTHELFCNDFTNKCKTHDKDEIFYIDNNHLSDYGNQFIIDQIFKVIK